MENSFINKGKTHSLYTFRHMNSLPQDIKFQLFWVILNRNHVFLAFDNMDGPYIQIDINFMVLLLLSVMLFYI